MNPEELIKSEAFQNQLAKDPEWRHYQDLMVYPPVRDELTKEFGTVDRGILNFCERMVDHFVTVGLLYWRSRKQGQSDRFAAMLALQTAPAVNTDDVFFHGLHHLGHQMPEEQAQQYVDAHIKATGKAPPQSAIYMPGLARFKGDPQAFISRSDGRTHIKRLIESRGGTCDRDMNVNWREPESDPLAPENCKPLGEDIIRGHMRTEVENNPDLAKGMTPKKRQALRQSIIQKHGPSS